MTEKFKSDLQIISVLQALDKYLIHLRKLKHLKNETVKANITAAREANKLKASKVSEVPQNQQAAPVEETTETKQKTSAKRSIKSGEEQSKENKENNVNTEEMAETAPCNKNKQFLIIINSEIICLILMKSASSRLIKRRGLVGKHCCETGSNYRHRFSSKCKIYFIFQFFFSVFYKSIKIVYIFLL